MTSHKRSAKAKRIAKFNAKLAEDREPEYRYKSCESKKRYATRFEAEAAIDACADWGTVGLSCYKCKYCDGWHLTSKLAMPE